MKQVLDLLFLLKEGQRGRGYLSAEVMLDIAQKLGVPVGHVYGVSTFYTFLSPRPLGRNVIRICRSVPCYLRGSDMIAQTISEALGIGAGETTGDGSFSLLWANCIGACDQAPAMMVNGEVYMDLTPKRIHEILGRYK